MTKHSRCTSFSVSNSASKTSWFQCQLHGRHVGTCSRLWSSFLHPPAPNLFFFPSVPWFISSLSPWIKPCLKLDGFQLYKPISYMKPLSPFIVLASLHWVLSYLDTNRWSHAAAVIQKTKQNKTKKHLAIANVQELHLAAIQANFRYLGSHIIGLLVQPHASQPNPCASALLSENKQLLRLKSCGKF